jgi:hypothetical protein
MKSTRTLSVFAFIAFLGLGVMSCWDPTDGGIGGGGKGGGGKGGGGNGGGGNGGGHDTTIVIDSGNKGGGGTGGGGTGGGGRDTTIVIDTLNGGDSTFVDTMIARHSATGRH